MQDNQWISVGSDIKADIKWFLHYASSNNGIFYYTPERSEVHIECDSSLYGGGGISSEFYYVWVYSQHHMCQYKNIVHLEAINLLVMYKTFAPRISTPGVKVVIFTDNQGSSSALETGKTRDETLAKCARELWLVATKYNQVITIRHKPGKDLELADALSRQSRDKAKAHLARQQVLSRGLVQLPPALNGYQFFNKFL